MAPYLKAYIDEEKKFKTEVMKTNDPSWEEKHRFLYEITIQTTQTIH